MLVQKISGIFILALCLFAPSLYAQKAKPQTVHRIIYEVKPNEWYLTQAKLWQKVVQKNPKNPEAWRNYYLAVRYSRPAQFTPQAFKEKNQKMEKILTEMGQNVPNSYDYYFLKFYHYSAYKKGDINLLKQAYAIHPDRPELYYFFIIYYFTHNNPQKAETFCKKLYRSKDIIPDLLDYNYNVMASCKPNAVLFTNGDNDTYPIWVLQSAKNIRPDITVINASLAMGYPKYLQQLLKKRHIAIDTLKLKHKTRGDFLKALIHQIKSASPDTPIYIALTLPGNNIKTLQDSMYIVGLAYRYSTEKLDNLALLNRNVSEKFRLDYLQHSWYTEDYLAKKSMDMLNLNYAVIFSTLVDHLYLSGQIEQVNRWKELALSLARKGGNQKLVRYLNSLMSEPNKGK